MIHQHTLADYHAVKRPSFQPGNQRGGGHFSAWRLEDFLSDLTLLGVYSRKDFYKITLTTGPATYHTADQHLLLAAGQPALVFTNTQLPYTWEVPDTKSCKGYCCVFTEAFLSTHTHVRPADWPVFAPESPPRRPVVHLAEQVPHLGRGSGYFDHLPGLCRSLWVDLGGGGVGAGLFQQ